MVRYIKSVVDLAGGTEKFSMFCADHDININLGSPPFVCLLPLRQPSATKLRLSLVRTENCLFTLRSIYYLILWKFIH